MKKILIANRGEIALRIQRAARDLGLASVALYSRDDTRARHRLLADEAVALADSGPAAYLDVNAVLAAARDTGCDAVHPGYGFLSERADVARACEAAGLCFIGPTADQLALFGDKGSALRLARECGVPVLPATKGNATLEEIREFFASQADAGIVIKAVGGGGGRGMRMVRRQEELAEAFARCRSEAASAFGIDALYAERLISRARHIEVQVVGDGTHVATLGERDCTLQRRFQKVIEVAPSPVLAPQLREQILGAATTLAARVGYVSLGTFEFLVEETDSGEQTRFVFIEANPRLQVEHTITEQVTGVDLVQVQIGLAAGQSLQAAGIDPANPPVPRGFAIQARINGESMGEDGLARPARGRLERFDPPSGLDVRVDTHGYNGYAPSAQFDTLLAKLIVTSRTPVFEDAVRRLRRALAEFRIVGIDTNLDLLRALADREDFVTQQDIHTRHFESILPDLTVAARVIRDADAAREPENERERDVSLRVLPTQEAVDEGLHAVRAPFTSRVVDVNVRGDEIVAAGQTVAVLEAMKMEHAITAPAAGRVVAVRTAPGEQVEETAVLLVLAPVDADEAAAVVDQAIDVATERADLQRVIARHAHLYDEARPAAVARRRARGQRTARENVADLCDADTFVEYGGLVLAAQATRRSTEDLIVNTPADGLITGIGSVNRDVVDSDSTRTAVMAYDATVLAGTQGKRNHIKTDRIVEVALRDALPLVLFGEGGGGRPGDVDFPSVSGLYQPSFASFAELSGAVPVVGIVSGRCFAGNAAFIGCCDVIIADRSVNLGMAGPAMIEGGGLGVYRPEDIGPAGVQYANGVIDVLVADEAQAVSVARHYLSLFQGRARTWSAPDPMRLRQVVPENRLRVYDTRHAIEGIADVDSVLMLRGGFGVGIHTALGRVEGQPVGFIANNPHHLGGAIDPDAADKAARFMQLCDAHGLPIVSLIDTPGFMVGPDVEARAQVRHVSRMFLTAAKLRVALLAVTLRKGYGLGAMAMAGGGFRSANFTVAWPTGEFGPMGLEGAIQLGFKKELEAVADGPERRALYDRLVAQAYERGHALSTAAAGEIDAVIDPAQTRQWVAQGIRAASLHAQRPRRSFIDAW